MSSILKQSEYCSLPFQTIETIRKYRINKHPRKLDLKRNTAQNNVNTQNPVKIKLNKADCKDTSCSL